MTDRQEHKVGSTPSTDGQAETKEKRGPVKLDVTYVSPSLASDKKDSEEEGSSNNGKSQDPSTCPKCGMTNGHKPDCSNRYRSCWTFGTRKGGVEK